MTDSEKVIPEAEVVEETEVTTPVVETPEE